MQSVTLAGRLVRIIPRHELARLLTLDRVVPAVEEAYVAHARGEAALFPVIRERIPEGVFGVKSGFWPQRDALGLKVAGYWPANRGRGLDNHQATVVLVDPGTGVPRAVLDGNHVTYIRTAAAGAIGARLLARPDAERALVVGTGVQADAQARALAWWRPGIRIAVVEPLDGPGRRAATAFAARLQTDGIAADAAVDLETAVREAEVVVTATPATAPLVARAWLAPGTHVNAMGADTAGKQEHDVATLRDARVVVDDWVQAASLGECQHGVAAGLFAGGRPALIGEILAGEAPGRTVLDEITLFDLTGIALQDLVVADLAARLAEAEELGTLFNLD